MPDTPIETIHRLIAARRSRDYETAVACYEPDATVVLRPGETGRGAEAIRAFVEGASALTIAFGEHTIVEGDAVALHLSTYTLQTDGSAIEGRTADVLRRDAQGLWLIAIDNAWA